MYYFVYKMHAAKKLNPKVEASFKSQKGYNLRKKEEEYEKIYMGLQEVVLLL